MKKVIHLALAATFMALAAPSAGHAVTYNLSTDFSNSANPNSVWSYVYGNTFLPNQPTAIANGNSSLATSRQARSVRKRSSGPP